MSSQTTFEGSPNATSSPGSAAGATPCVSPAGQTIGLCGLARAPANLSARQAKERGLLTSGTFGPHSTISSVSAALQSSLASRLQARTASVGSTLYKLTWKDRATPSGQLICALRASARPISDSGYGGSEKGWPTPTTRDWKSGGTDLTNSWVRKDGKLRNDLLDYVAWASGWPTPKVTDTNGPGNSTNRQGGMALHTAVAEFSGWTTPQAHDTSGRSKTQKDIHGTKHGCACLVRDTDKIDFDGPARLTASGQVLTGSSAGMESGGQLNPAFSLWLMGYPAEWVSCGARAMQSSRKPRKPSSKPTKKPSVFD